MVRHRVEDLPQALLGLVDLAAVFVEDGEVEQRVHVRPVLAAHLLVVGDGLVLLTHQVQEIRELELVLGVVVPLDRLAQLLDGLRPIALGLQVEGLAVMGVGGRGIGHRLAGPDHGVKYVFGHGSLRM